MPRSIGMCANAADVYPELVRRGVTPDLVTEQTAAHDPLVGYVPQGLSLEEAAARRLERVLTIDPGMGVIRHADAGYETALRVAEEKGVRVPHRQG